MSEKLKRCKACEETENDDGSSAYDILDEGEYEEESA